MRVKRIVITLAVLLAMGGYLFISLVEPRLWRSKTRRHAIQALKAAQTEDQLKEAVGPWGVFVPGKDGSWVAIRYRDRHAGGSLSVARDSGGQWFECRRHFCGSLPNYADRRLEFADKTNLLSEMFPVRTNQLDMASYQQLEALFSASDLKAIRQALELMGFQQITLK